MLKHITVNEFLQTDVLNITKAKNSTLVITSAVYLWQLWHKPNHLVEHCIHVELTNISHHSVAEQ